MGSTHRGAVAPSGGVTLQKIDRAWPAEHGVREILRHGFPRRGLAPGVAAWRSRNLPNLWRGAWRVLVARCFGVPTHYGVVWAQITRGDGRVEQLGLVSMRLVTDTGVGYIVDAFQNIVELENMKFHGFGTGTGTEAAADAALGTELTTQYAVDNTRPTGSQTETSANIYRTVGTLSPDSGGTIAVTEHGVFSASSAGVLLDRSKFSAMNLVAGSDSLQVTYDFTITSGG